MDLTQAALFALTGVSLLNLVLVLRLAARNRAADTFRGHDHGPGGEPLAIGAVAPPFNAQTLGGQGMTDERLAGRTVAYLFMSPNCDHCRDVLPTLEPVATAAARSGTQLVVVTDVGPVRARQWLDLVRDEDGVEVKLPVLAAPPGRTTMLAEYNRPGVLPYFVVVSKLGRVAARGHIGGPDWQAQLATWSAAGAPDAARS